MKIILIEPMEKPKVIDIEHTLENLQELVGGTIQALYPWEDRVAIVCNDEGKFNGMLANRLLEDYDLICGPFFICGLSEEDFDSIPDDLVEKYTEKFQYPEMFMRRMDGKLICFRLGSDEKPILIG